MSTRYTKDHEWVRMDGDVAVVGVSEHAQEQLGDVVFVELPDKGAQVSPGDNMAVVESVKSASEVYAPISGEVVEVNSGLEDKPALVNESPEADGWFVRIRPSAPDEFEALMDRDAYEAYLATLD